MIITIDGAGGTGKSTVAKGLARQIGFVYFDTGAMYRCMTYAVLKNHINLEDTTLLQDFLSKFHYSIKIKKGEKAYYLDDEDLTAKIRSAEITSNVSRISANFAVREKLVALQRDFAVGVNAIFEGRDMGTVVFPAAEVKIFLTGKPEIRARRRFNELRAKFPDDTVDLKFEQVFEDIKTRDEYDSNREISPLKPASDAYIIDTSDLTSEEVITHILEYKDSLKNRKKTP